MEDVYVAAPRAGHEAGDGKTTYDISAEPIAVVTTAALEANEP